MKAKSSLEVNAPDEDDVGRAFQTKIDLLLAELAPPETVLTPELERTIRLRVKDLLVEGFKEHGLMETEAQQLGLLVAGAMQFRMKGIK